MTRLRPALLLLTTLSLLGNERAAAQEPGKAQVNPEATQTTAPTEFDLAPPAGTESRVFSDAPPGARETERMAAPLGESETETQDSPAADAFSGFFARPLPDYYFDPEYYRDYGVGARAIADYAPPGYEARDYQDAPGVPELSPIIPPPLPASDAPVGLVTRGMYPNSFLIPGINTSFRLRGFVRLAMLYDFQPAGLRDAFVTNSIPVPQQVGENFNVSGRISRFAIESWTPTEFLDWNVHTFIEGDFFNGADQAAGGGGNPFRLRHAFFDFGYFRFGQQNSVFMDPNSWPSLVDFQGPNSWVNQRQPSARVTLPLPIEGLYWAASVERPFSDITTNNLGTNVQSIPDGATHLRYERPKGHLQVAGLFRSIAYRPTGGAVDRDTAAAVSGTAVFHPWAILLGTDPAGEDPSGLTRSRILLMGTWGPGVGRYINDLAGQGLDAQVDPITGALNVVTSTAWNASYECWFNEHWLSNFTYSHVNTDPEVNQPATTYSSGTYLAASLWWIPIPRLSFGIEYMWGERENLDGQEAEAERLHGLAQYNF